MILHLLSLEYKSHHLHFLHIIAVVDSSLLMRYKFRQLSDIVAITQLGQLARYTKPERYGNPCMINTINLARISAIAIADCHEYLVWTIASVPLFSHLYFTKMGNAYRLKPTHCYNTLPWFMILLCHSYNVWW